MSFNEQREVRGASIIRFLPSITKLPDWDWSYLQLMCWWSDGKSDGSLQTGIKDYVMTNLCNVTSLESAFQYNTVINSAILTGFSSSLNTAVSAFYRCPNLETVCIAGDFSGVTTFAAMFYGCSNLETVIITGDCSKISTIASMFEGCAKMKSFNFSGLNIGGNVNSYRIERSFCYSGVVDTNDIKGLDWSKASYVYSLFEGCENLKHAGDFYMPKSYQWSGIFKNCVKLETVGNLTMNPSYTPNVHDVFFNCTSLSRIESWTFGYTYNNYLEGTFVKCDTLKYCVINNLGKSSSDSAINIRMVAQNWGADSDENLQSLVDSLVNNTFDRVAYGYTTPCNIYLHADQLARLTDEQKAHATAKGFSLIASPLWENSIQGYY